jgi:hypothetical protein
MLWPVLRQSARKAFEAPLRQRVAEELADHGRRQGGDLRAHLGRFDQVHRVADGRDQDFRLQVGIVTVDLQDVGDQPHAVRGDVVQAADEGGHEGRARLGGQQRLRRGEAEGDVHHGPVGRQGAAGAQPGFRQRHLHRHVGRDLAQVPAFGQHGFVVGGGDLGRDRAGGDGADLGYDVRHAPPGLGDRGSGWW